ncbi:PDZ and LIM domain protein 3-like [Aplochiton taeniatus]
MPQNLVLKGGPPWGFRMTEGKNVHQPVSISRVTPGSMASLANLCPGDIILAIGDVATEDMTLDQAQNSVRDSTHQLILKIQRPETQLWSPQVEASLADPASPFRLNLQTEPQELNHFEHQFNVRPKPFKAFTSSASPNNSPPAANATDNGQPCNDVRHPVTRSVVAPVTKPLPAVATLQKLPLCDRCGKGIIGPVVHAGEKWRHPACFVCVACGADLKHQGYFLFDGQLYCEIHAYRNARHGYVNPPA